MLVPIPDDLAPATVASVSDNVPDGWRTVAHPLERRPGADVLIVGGGAPSIGLYAVDAAKALGAGRITYLDEDPERLRVAEQLGAHVHEGPPPHKLGSYAITVDAGATRESLHCALRSTEPGGDCTSVGILWEAETPLPLLEMYTEGVSFHTGRAQARPTIPAILELVLEGRLHPETVDEPRGRLGGGPGSGPGASAQARHRAQLNGGGVRSCIRARGLRRCRLQSRRRTSAMLGCKT